MIPILARLATLWASPLVRVGAVLAVLVAYTATVAVIARRGVAERVETKVVTRVVQAQAKETERRVEVLRTVQARSQKDIETISRQATRLAALEEETRRASIALDSATCLPASSLVRLAAVR